MFDFNFGFNAIFVRIQFSTIVLFLHVIQFEVVSYFLCPDLSICLFYCLLFCSFVEFVMFIYFMCISQPLLSLCDSVWYSNAGKNASTPPKHEERKIE